MDNKPEPDWNALWDDKMGNITYAGVRLISCRECGDYDQNCCDCAKAVWIRRKKKEYIDQK